MNIFVFIYIFSITHAFTYLTNCKIKKNLCKQYITDYHINNVTNNVSNNYIQIFYKPNHIEEKIVYSVTGIEPWNLIQ